MVSYPQDYNPILEYHNLIQSGKEIVSIKIRKVYEKLVFDLTDRTSRYVYNHQRANHVIEFVENYCKHSKGKMAGKPFVLELWQKAAIAAAFGFIDVIDETRKYRELILIVARKNGKSALGSALALYMLLADGEGGPEVVSAATKRDQAKIIWLESKRMVKKSPVLSKRVRPLVAELISDFNDGSFKPLSSDSNTLDGLNVHCSLIDELHAIEDKNIYDVIVDGMSAREQPMSIITTTAGTVREGIFDLKYEECTRIINGFFDADGYKDDRVLPLIYELDSRDEWTNKSAWKKANPGLGTIKQTDQLETKVNKAIENTRLVNNLLTKDFNIRDTVGGSWLTFEDINNTDTYDIADHRGTYAIGGVDLSSTSDLTAATLLWKKDSTFYIAQMYFIPRDIAEQKEREDKVPYGIWEKHGWVTFCEGSRVDYSDVTAWFLKMRDEHEIIPLWTGFDNWNAQYFTTEMESNNFIMEIVIQGAKTMSAPMKQLEAEFKGRKINYNNNPVLKWNLTNTQIKSDDNGNIRPIKGRNPKMRIDGTVSLIDAFVIYMRHHEDYTNLL